MNPNAAANLTSRWKPGVSGNPQGGRLSTLKLAGYIRGLTQNGRELTDFLLSVMRGEPLSLPGKNGGQSAGQRARPRPELRVRAAEILLDRAFGKAKELIELVGEPSDATSLRRTVIAHMTEEEQAQLRTVLQTAIERAARAGALPPGPGSGAPGTAPDDGARVKGVITPCLRGGENVTPGLTLASYRRERRVFSCPTRFSNSATRWRNRAVSA
jgi:hypothetical protein